MSVFAGPNETTNSMILHLDAGNPKSYPGSGTVWYDLSTSAQHFNIVATAFNSSGPKYMDFNGSYGCAKRSSDTTYYNTDITAVVWTRILNSTTNWRTLFRGLSTGQDHQVIIQQSGNTLGMYDNTNSTAFNSSGYTITNLPGFNTQWNMLVWRFNNTSSPYYTFSYNDTPDVARGTITSTNARFKSGICSIGAYNNGTTTPSDASQYWGDVSSVMMYNRLLTDEEIKTNFYAMRGRYGI